MAARIRRQHQEEVRARIQTSQLVNRLTNHALGKLGKKPMDSSQVTAALGLLKKCLPDLNALEHSGEVVTRPAREMTDDELASIAAGRGARAADQAEGAVEHPPLRERH